MEKPADKRLLELTKDSLIDLSFSADLPSGFASFRSGIQKNNSQFVRPDRQTNFRCRPLWEWPLPKHDQTTTSVDRVGETAEQGPHRFTICLGDVVRVWMGDDQFQLGRVVEISPEHSTVSVKLGSKGARVWFCAERLYPARQDELPDPRPEPKESPSYAAPISGKQIQTLMRRHQLTIGELSKRMQIGVVSRNPRKFRQPPRPSTSKLLDALGQASERFVHVLQCLGFSALRT